MTDKEIIIDGVDVSECEFLWKERLPRKVCNNGNLDCDCNSNPNCYYKQLKHKEQECETLICQLDFEVQKKECLEQECEELNKQVNDLLNKPEIQDKILWKIDNEALLGSKDTWIYKLKQTLAKIKEIAEKRNYLDYNECLDDILQKISECEVEDE